MPIKNKALLLLMSLLTTNLLYNTASAELPDVTKYIMHDYNGKDKRMRTHSNNLNHVYFGNILNLAENLWNSKSIGENNEGGISNVIQSNRNQFIKYITNIASVMTASEYEQFANRMQYVFRLFNVTSTDIDVNKVRFLDKSADTNGVLKNIIINKGRINLGVILGNDSKGYNNFEKNLVQLQLLNLGVNAKKDVLNALYDIYKKNNTTNEILKIALILAKAALYEINNSMNQNNQEQSDNVVSSVLYKMLEFGLTKGNMPYLNMISDDIKQYITKRYKNINSSDKKNITLTDTEFARNSLSYNILYYCNMALKEYHKPINLFENANIVEHFKYLIRSVTGLYSSLNRINSTKDSRIKNALYVPSVLLCENLVAMKEQIIENNDVKSPILKELSTQKEQVKLLDMVAKTNAENKHIRRQDYINFVDFRKNFNDFKEHYNAKRNGYELLEIRNISDLINVFSNNKIAVKRVMKESPWDNDSIRIKTIHFEEAVNHIQDMVLPKNENGVTIITPEIVNTVFLKVLNTLNEAAENNELVEYFNDMESKKNIISMFLSLCSSCKDFNRVKGDTYQFLFDNIKNYLLSSKSLPVRNFYDWFRKYSDYYKKYCNEHGADEARDKLGNITNIISQEFGSINLDKAEGNINIQGLVSLLKKCYVLNLEGLEGLLGKNFEEFFTMGGREPGEEIKRSIEDFEIYLKTNKIFQFISSNAQSDDNKEILKNILSENNDLFDNVFDLIRNGKAQEIIQILKNNTAQYDETVKNLLTGVSKNNMKDTKRQLINVIKVVSGQLSKIDGYNIVLNENAITNCVNKIINFLVSMTPEYYSIFNNIDTIKFINLLKVMSNSRYIKNNKTMQKYEFEKCFLISYILNTVEGVVFSEEINERTEDKIGVILTKLYESVSEELFINIGNGVQSYDVIMKLAYLGERNNNFIDFIKQDQFPAQNLKNKDIQNQNSTQRNQVQVPENKLKRTALVLLKLHELHKCVEDMCQFVLDYQHNGDIKPKVEKLSEIMQELKQVELKKKKSQILKNNITELNRLVEELVQNVRDPNAAFEQGSVNKMNEIRIFINKILQKQNAQIANVENLPVLQNNIGVVNQQAKTEEDPEKNNLNVQEEQQSVSNDSFCSTIKQLSIK